MIEDNKDIQCQGCGRKLEKDDINKVDELILCLFCLPSVEEIKEFYKRK